MDCLNQIQSRIQQVVKYSGHFFQRIGSFDSCISTNQMIYRLILFANNQTKIEGGEYLGLCLPSICSSQYIRSDINTFLNLTQLPLIVSEIKEYTEDKKYPLSWSFYFTIVLLAIILLTVLISSLFPKKVQKIKIVHSFNIIQSLKIFKSKKNNLNILNGVRSLSMFWVIWAHEQIFNFNASNVANLREHTQTILFLFVEGGLFAVDTFFFLGGFLVAYTFVKNSQNKSWSKYPMAIIHRILRIWPCYLIAILIYYSIFIHAGRGPFWYESELQINYCSNMWKPLLFVDNFVDQGQQMCLVWGWYIQNDIQIFIFSIIIFSITSLSSLFKRFFNFFISLIILASVIYTFSSVMINQYVQVTKMEDFAKWNEYFSSVYIKPWARCPPYFYGLLLGAAYVKFEIKNEGKDNWLERLKEKFKESRKWRLCWQFSGIGVMLFIILIPRTLQLGYIWPKIIHAFYLSLGKLVFVVALSATILPSILGLKSFVAFSLDSKIFNFIAKISFTTYLIHLMFTYLPYFGRRIDFYYSQLNLISHFFTHLILSLISGFILTVCVEVPFSKIQKLLISVFKRQENHKSIIHEKLLLNASIQPNK